jgi:hypothetical protein
MGDMREARFAVIAALGFWCAATIVMGLLYFG